MLPTTTRLVSTVNMILNIHDNSLGSDTMATSVHPLSTAATPRAALPTQAVSLLQQWGWLERLEVSCTLPCNVLE